ncbi:unnamed protein product [Linum trigynum]|uniref:Uncharacterized protein n=1 Tax=Linum trigynum TaxID=586398 RepID=A0AAV2FVJ1_9ROSI
MENIEADHEKEICTYDRYPQTTLQSRHQSFKISDDYSRRSFPSQEIKSSRQTTYHKKEDPSPKISPESTLRLSSDWKSLHEEIMGRLARVKELMEEEKNKKEQEAASARSIDINKHDASSCSIHGEEVKVEVEVEEEKDKVLVDGLAIVTCEDDAQVLISSQEVGVGIRFGKTKPDRTEYKSNRNRINVIRFGIRKRKGHISETRVLSTEPNFRIPNRKTELL